MRKAVIIVWFVACGNTFRTDRECDKLPESSQSADNILLMYGARNNRITIIAKPDLGKMLETRWKSGCSHYFDAAVSLDDLETSTKRHQIVNDLIIAQFGGKAEVFVRQSTVLDRVSKPDKYNKGLPVLTKVYRIRDVHRFMHQDNPLGSPTARTILNDDLDTDPNLELFITVPESDSFEKYVFDYEPSIGLFGYEPHSPTVDVFSIKGETTTKSVTLIKKIDSKRFWNCYDSQCNRNKAIGKHWLDLYCNEKHRPSFNKCSHSYENEWTSSGLRMMRSDDAASEDLYKLFITSFSGKRRYLPEDDGGDAELFRVQVVGEVLVTVRKGILMAFRLDQHTTSLNRVFNMIPYRIEETDQFGDMPVFVLDKFDHKHVIVAVAHTKAFYYKTYTLPEHCTRANYKTKWESTIYATSLKLASFVTIGYDKLRMKSGARIRSVTLHNDRIHIYCTDQSARIFNISSLDNDVQYVNMTVTMITDGYDGRMVASYWADDERRLLQRWKGFSFIKSHRGLHLEFGASLSLSLTSQKDYDAAMFLYGNPFIDFRGTEVLYGLTGCILFVMFDHNHLKRLNTRDYCGSPKQDIRIFMAESRMVVLSQEVGDRRIFFHTVRLAFKLGQPTYAKIKPEDLKNVKNVICDGFALKMCFLRNDKVSCAKFKSSEKGIDENDHLPAAELCSLDVVTSNVTIANTDEFKAYPIKLAEQIHSKSTTAMYSTDRDVLIRTDAHLYSLNETKMVNLSHGSWFDRNFIYAGLPCSNGAEITSWISDGDIISYEIPKKHAWSGQQYGRCSNRERKTWSIDVASLLYFGNGIALLHRYEPTDTWFHNYSAKFRGQRKVAEMHSVHDETVQPEHSKEPSFSAVIKDRTPCSPEPRKAILFGLLGVMAGEVCSLLMLVCYKVAVIDRRLKKRLVKATVMQKLGDAQRKQLVWLRRKLRMKRRNEQDSSSPSSSSSSSNSDERTDLRSREEHTQAGATNVTNAEATNITNATNGAEAETNKMTDVTNVSHVDLTT